MNENEIIEHILNKNEQGMAEFLIHYGALIRYVITPIIKDPQDREECITEIAMTVWKKIDMFDENRGSWTTWITAIARNTAINKSRHINETISIEDISTDIASDELTPEEIVLNNELKIAVNDALSKLSIKDRTMFYRKYYYMQSTIQIASELGMTERAVEGKLYRLKKKLRKILGEQGYE